MVRIKYIIEKENGFFFLMSSKEELIFQNLSKVKDPNIIALYLM